MATKTIGGYNQFGGNDGFNTFGAGGFSGNNSSIVYDPDAQAWFNAMLVQMNPSLKAIYNTLVLALKSSLSLRGGGVTNWDEIIALWILMGANRQASYLNGRYPTATPISDVIAPSFTPFQGLQGNGTTQYVNLNFNPTVAVVPGAGMVSQNDSAVFVWGESNGSGTGVAMGSTNVSNQGTLINTRTATNIMQGSSTGANANIGSAGSTLDAAGFKMIRRVNATQIRTNKDGIAVGSEIVTNSNSISPVNQSYFGLNRNANGIPSITGYDSKMYSIMGVCKGFIDPVSLYQALLAFKS